MQALVNNQGEIKGWMNLLEDTLYNQYLVKCGSVENSYIYSGNRQCIGWFHNGLLYNTQFVEILKVNE